jgi:hypothetical protein
MDSLMTPAQRRERHKAWLASFGFSDEDWRRIRLLAQDVTDRGSPPALNDLSVPIHIAAMPESSRRSGKLLGVITRADGFRVALVYWTMSDHERGFWQRRRGEVAG